MTKLTPLRAIRQKCLDCCCGQAYEVKLCPCIDCVLHPFRFGHNPNRAGIGGDGISRPKTLTHGTIDELECLNR